MNWARILLGLIAVLFIETVALAATPNLKIDRVLISGVNVFPLATIESTVEVLPGQIFDRHLLLTSEESMQSFYRLHGYNEMTVKARLTQRLKEDGEGQKKVENVLEFEVAEGRPIRIADVEVVSLDQDPEFLRETWKFYEGQIKNSLKIAAGEVLDQGKISESRRAIQESLLSKNFISAGVSQVDFESVTSRVEKDSSRWVKVRFQVDLGDRVYFSFRGNSFFTWSDLQSWVEDLRSSGLGKDYLQAIRKKVEDEYRAAGFAKVVVTSYTVEESKRRGRKVIYAIEEGPRVKIDSVEFDGNLGFTTEKLRSKFFSKASGLVQNGIYVEKDVQKAAELLTEWMKERGFLSAKVVTINTVYPAIPRTTPGVSTVRLTVFLYEGNQTILRRVGFAGRSFVSEAEIKGILGVKEGEPLNIFAFGEGVEALKKTYRDAGFLDFQIQNEGKEGLVRYFQENRQVDISLELLEGPQYRVSQIQLEGLQYTQPSIVLRELVFREGDLLGEAAMMSSERQLRKLGIFSLVTIKAIDEPLGDGKKAVVVRVVESDRGTFVGGPGYRYDLGLRLFGQLTYTDLWGKNHTISTSLSANRRFFLYNFIEGQGQINYTWPWFGIPGLTFRPNLNAGRTQYLDFTTNAATTSFAADNVSTSLSWDKMLASQRNLVGSFTYSFEYIRQFMAVSSSSDNGTLTIGTVTPRLTVDLRDNSLLPTSGFYSTAWFDFSPQFLGSGSGRGLGSNIGFYRAQFRADYHVPLPKRFGLYFSFRTGFEQSLVSNSDPTFNSIPLIKQFSLGGVGSLRGYNELELNTLTSQNLQGLSSNVIQNSLSYLNYRAQMDIPLTGSLKFDVFLDSANLLINDYGFKYMLYGTGLGIRFLTPVGSVNFDYGYKLNPPPGTKDKMVAHFSVGVI